MEITTMPVAKQLSIFLENKAGVLARVCETFAKEKVNILGMSVSDTVDHAVVRIVTSDHRRAVDILEDSGVLVVENDVLALTLPDKPGQLATVAQKLAKAKINIEYAYGTTEAKGGVLILRVSDLKKAQKVLKVK
jgi:hypothetical protein